MDVTLSMENICKLLSSLTDQNKKWLADHLYKEIGGSTEHCHNEALADSDLISAIENARREYREGKCVECNTHEELNAYLESL